MKSRANVEQRQGFDDTFQHTNAQTLMKYYSLGGRWSVS